MKLSSPKLNEFSFARCISHTHTHTHTHTGRLKGSRAEQDTLMECDQMSFILMISLPCCTGDVE